MKRYFSLCICLFIFSFLSAQLEINLEQIASGLSSPIGIEHAGDDRLFIQERSGRIRIIDGNGTLLSTPFLDINAIVHNSGGQSEQGLLGLAFHPDYANNGYFFIHYTANNDDGIIARYSVDPDDPNLADATSEVVIMTLEQPYTNHNGGEIAFGPDGYLYIGTGDGGAANDPQNFSQNRQSLLGKMLRIDIDNGLPYTIPADNPFANTDETLDEIWAIGLRNPWRFSFDRETGDLWIGDVGQGQWEEIDFQPANSAGGENYGWRCFEGNNNFNTSGCNDMSTYTAAAVDYNHQGFTHCSVTGGHVYRGQEFPELTGHYLFADYCSGQFWATKSDGNEGWDTQEIGRFSNYDISAFGEDANGEIYVARMGQGRIYKVTLDVCSGFNAEAQGVSPSCLGGNDGSILLNVSGGTEPYSYTVSLENLLAGHYLFDVTDANDCVVTVDVMITNPEGQSVAIFFDESTNMLNSTDNFASYQWYVDGAPIMDANAGSYTAMVSGDYYVEVVGMDGCTYQSEVITVMLTHVNTIEGLNKVLVHPNPFNDVVQFQMESTRSFDFTLRILDVQGKVLLEQSHTAQNGLLKTLDLSKLARGTYLLSLKTEQGQYLDKLVKQ